MRRISIAVLISGLAIVAMPAAASARHRQHGRHHSRVHHARVRHERFGSSDTATSTSQEKNAGTVLKFDGTTLTIQLANSTVSGAVTKSTEFECRAPESSTMSGAERDSSGDHGGSGDDNGGSTSGDDNSASTGNDDAAEANDNDAAEANDNDAAEANDNDAAEMGEEQQQACDSSSLAPGTTVREAELKVSSAGASWEKVELISG